jgi:biotin-(acetyl-CoA carboxylase) ligase
MIPLKEGTIYRVYTTKGKVFGAKFYGIDKSGRLVFTNRSGLTTWHKEAEIDCVEPVE